MFCFSFYHSNNFRKKTQEMGYDSKRGNCLSDVRGAWLSQTGPLGASPCALRLRVVTLSPCHPS